MPDVMLSSLEDDKRNPLFEASLIAGLGTISAVLFAYDPVLIFALVSAVAIAILLILRPALALKFVLLLGAIPLEWLGAPNPDEKPLMRALGGTSVDGLRLVFLSAALALLLLKSGRVHMPKGFRWYLVFVGFLALSLTYSGARFEGLRLVVKVIYPVLIFFATSRFIRRSQEIDSALNYWIAGGLLATVIGILTYLFRGSTAFIWGEDLRYSSGLTHASPFSMYMLALFTLCYGVWRTTLKKGYALLALLFGTQAMMAQTRITWAALLIGLLVLESSVERRPGRMLRASVVVASLTFLIGYSVWSSPALQHRFFGTQFDPDASALETIQDLNLSGRAFVWAAVYEDYQSNNLWRGQGAGTSEVFLANYEPGGPSVPHNEYLRLLHDTGLIGMGLFLAGIGGLLWFLHTLRKGMLSQRQRLFTAIALALLVGYAIEAITDNPLDYYLVYSQYVFFALGLALVESRSLPGVTAAGERTA